MKNEKTGFNLGNFAKQDVLCFFKDSQVCRIHKSNFNVIAAHEDEDELVLTLEDDRKFAVDMSGDGELGYGVDACFDYPNPLNSDYSVAYTLRDFVSFLEENPVAAWFWFDARELGVDVDKSLVNKIAFYVDPDDCDIELRYIAVEDSGDDSYHLVHEYIDELLVACENDGIVIDSDLIKRIESIDERLIKKHVLI